MKQRRHASPFGAGRRSRALLPTLAALTGLLGLAVGCSHLDPYENVAAVANEPNDPQRLLIEMPAPKQEHEPPLAFVGTLPDALRDVDTLRRGLLKTAGEMSGERSFYDAALWTLTPYMLYRAVTGGGTDSKNTLAAGAALLGAGYGFLNARPKEYEQIYVDGSKRLACLMVDYTRYLYTEEEFDPASGGTVGRQWQAYETAVIRYRTAAYEAARATAGLPAAPGKVTCAAAGDCAARTAALSKAPPDRKRAAVALQTESDAHAARAQASLTKLRRLSNQVRFEAALGLRVESRQLMSSIGGALRDKRPELETMAAAITALQKSIDAVAAVAAASAPAAAAQSKRKHGDDDSGTALRSLVLPASLRGTEVEAEFHAAEKDMFWRQNRADLALSAQADKGRSVGQLYTRMACPAKIASPLTALAASAPAADAPKPSETPLSQ